MQYAIAMGQIIDVQWGLGQSPQKMGSFRKLLCYLWLHVIEKIGEHDVLLDAPPIILLGAKLLPMASSRFPSQWTSLIILVIRHVSVQLLIFHLE